jgi:hypothetical protein
MEDRETPRIHECEESKTVRFMMENFKAMDCCPIECTVPEIGLRIVHLVA